MKEILEAHPWAPRSYFVEARKQAKADRREYAHWSAFRTTLDLNEDNRESTFDRLVRLTRRHILLQIQLQELQMEIDIAIPCPHIHTDRANNHLRRIHTKSERLRPITHTRSSAQQRNTMKVSFRRIPKPGERLQKSMGDKTLLHTGISR